MLAKTLILAAALAMAAPAVASEKTPVLKTPAGCAKERKNAKNSASKECDKQGKTGTDQKNKQDKAAAKK